MQQKQSVLAFGFSPATAVATWRLSESQDVDVYTYWPVRSLNFDSEVFGKNRRFEAKHFNIANPKDIGSLGFKSFNVVLLVVPTVNDIKRMCERLKPVISKNTLILVDVSGGMGPIQRHVKSTLNSSSPVMGTIVDIEAEVTDRSDKTWTLYHRQLESSGRIINIEPVASSKQLAGLEAAWNKGGISAGHPKNTSGFGEIQWQRTIGVVAFELLGFSLKIPEPELVLKNIAAQPLVAGLISELSMVAMACGVKNLPSKSQLIARGPKLARKAPANFRLPNASRIFYEHSQGIKPPLDSLLLLPIILSSELSKGGPTPYLECLYTFTCRILETNNSPIDPQMIEELNIKEKTLSEKEEKYNELYEQLIEKNQQLEQEVSKFNDQKQDLENSSKERDEWKEELQRLEEQLVKKERMLAQKEGDLYNREHALHSREAFVARNETPVTVNGSQGSQLGNTTADTENSANNSSYQSASTPPQPASYDDPSAGLETPGGTVYSRFDPKAPIPKNKGNNDPNGSVESMPENMAIANPAAAMPPANANGYYKNGYPVYPQQPYGPRGAPMSAPVMGGPGYAPMPPAPGAGYPQAYPIRSGAATPVMGAAPMGAPPGAMGPGVVPMSGQFYSTKPGSMNSMHAYGGAPGPRPRISAPPPANGMPPQGYNGSRPASRNQMMPTHYSMQFPPAGPGYPQPKPTMRKPGARKQGISIDDYDVMGMPGRRPRGQSMMPAPSGGATPVMHNAAMAQPPQGPQSFSQNFQLDGVMGSATDRYHFVSRGKNKKDPKLSSDDSALQAQRRAHHSGKSDISFDLNDQPRQFTPSQITSPSRNRKPVIQTNLSVGDSSDFPDFTYSSG